MARTDAQKKRANREKMQRYRQRQKLLADNVGIPPHLQFRKKGRPPNHPNHPLISSTAPRPPPTIHTGRGPAIKAYNNAEEKIIAWSDQLEETNKTSYKAMKDAMNTIIGEATSCFEWLRTTDDSWKLFFIEKDRGEMEVLMVTRSFVLDKRFRLIFVVDQKVGAARQTLHAYIVEFILCYQ